MEWGWGVGKDMGLWRLKRGERFALSDGFERTGYIRKIEREGGFKEVLLSVSPTPQCCPCNSNPKMVRDILGVSVLQLASERRRFMGT